APIANAVLIVRDGKVVAAGARDKVTIPEDAEVHDLGSAVLIPGLVIAETTLGERGRDDERTLTPEFRAIDGFDYFADYTRALSGGVTTVHTAPGARGWRRGRGGVSNLAGAARAAPPPGGRGTLPPPPAAASNTPPRIYDPPVGAVSVDRPLEPTRQQLSTSLA